MKHHILSLTIAAALFGTAAIAADRPVAAVNVPFDFVAGKSKLPAGRYQIDRTHPNVLRLSTVDRRTSATLIVDAATRPETDMEGKLVFNRYGNQNFLANIWAPGAGDGYLLRVSPLEKELRSQAQQSSSHVIAARKR